MKAHKKDAGRIKDEIKHDLRQLKADKKAREREDKARAKLKDANVDRPALSTQPTRLFGRHYSSAQFQENALTFARACFAWLEEADCGRIGERGIYRVSGAQSAVQQLRAQFDAHAAFVLPPDTDVNAVTGVLKLFFREMPEPLVPYSLCATLALDACRACFHLFVRHFGAHSGSYESLLAAVEITDDTRTATLRGLFSILPNVNRYLFAALMDHLYENLMDANNLAIVFAPNLLRPEDDSPENVLADAMPATELVAMVIANPALYLADSKLAQAHAISPTHEPQQRDVYDEMAEHLDPLQLAYYIQYYVAQGCDQSSAKKWAVYYLWEAQKERLRLEYEASQSARSEAPAQRAILKRATTDGTPTHSATWSAHGSSDSSVPAITLSRVDEDGDGDRRRTVDDTWSAPVGPRGSGVVANPRVAIGHLTRRSDALPSSTSEPALSVASSASNGPPKRAPPTPVVRGSTSGASSTATTPSTTPRESPTASPRSTPSSPHKPPLPPKRPNAPLPESKPPAHAPPLAPKVESVARERLSSRQRNRGMSIVQMRKNFGGSDAEYQQKMQLMLETYRAGEGNLDSLK